MYIIDIFCNSIKMIIASRNKAVFCNVPRVLMEAIKNLCTSMLKCEPLLELSMVMNPTT